jgi:uncharacterized protein (TIGR00255 family)
MKSMTGYGRIKTAFLDCELEIVIKSVNSRFLDVKFYLPKELSYLEPQFMNFLKNSISRGAVSVSVNLQISTTNVLSLDEELMKAYLQIFESASKITNFDDKISLDKILSLPNVIRSNPLNYEDLDEFILEQFEKALEKHQIMAESEGKSMQTYLTKSIEIMKQSLENILNNVQDYKLRIFARLRSNIESILNERLDEDGLKKVMLEAAIYTEKADITEELIRLKDHLNKLSESIEQKNTGKKCNFILQEMHREINTIGSKYNDFFNEVLIIKEEIEKCREIVQNVQ